jgi:hypothetical protein
MPTMVTPLNANNGKLADGITIGTMLCPSSPLPPMIQVGVYWHTRPSYVGISGATNHDGFPEPRISACCAPPDGQISGGGFLIPNAALRQCELSDGLSNIIAISEASNFAVDAAGLRRSIDGSFPTGWMTGTTAIGTPPTYNPLFSPACYGLTTIRYQPNSRDYDRPGIRENHGANNPLMSAHTGGVHALVSDGAVRFLNDGIDMRNLKRLATRDDAGVVEPF